MLWQLDVLNQGLTFCVTGLTRRSHLVCRCAGTCLCLSGSAPNSPAMRQITDVYTCCAERAKACAAGQPGRWSVQHMPSLPAAAAAAAQSSPGEAAHSPGTPEPRAAADPAASMHPLTGVGIRTCRLPAATPPPPQSQLEPAISFEGTPTLAHASQSRGALALDAALAELQDEPDAGQSELDFGAAEGHAHPPHGDGDADVSHAWRRAA